MKVRTRYAPSPTGFQHIGGIRTALYAYLFALKHKGSLLLRIEDTDQSRYVEGAEKYIIESLGWLNIVPHEGVGFGGDLGPYRQSDRKEIYQKYIEQLVASGHAYYAFDTSEELKEKRQELEKSKRAEGAYSPLYRQEMRNSLSLSTEETDALMAKGEYTIRLKIPVDQEVVVQDVVRGSVRFQTNLMDDKVLFKSDGMPTYHLANVVDDHLMEITHVIRGEEWLSSTPLHVLLYRAFGWEDSMPVFAHLPLLLKPDGKGKLSKRAADKLGFPVFPLAWEHPVTDESSNGYRELGFIPEAFLNFLAFQGWNPGTEQEIFNMQELADAFSLERVIKAGCKFSFDKAKWYNEQYLRNKSGAEICDMAWNSKPDYIQDADKDKLTTIAEMLKEKMTLPSDLWNLAECFFKRPEEYDAKTVRSKWKEDNIDSLKSVINNLSNLDTFSAENLEKNIKDYIANNELSFGNILLPLRVMLTGSKGGPDLFQLMELLGKEEVVERLNNASEQFELMTA